MEAIKLKYGIFERYSLLKMGLIVIISIMILTFVYASSQIKINQDLLVAAINENDMFAERLNTESQKAIKRSKYLLEMLLPTNNDISTSSSFQEKENVDGADKFTLYRRNVLPKLASNLEFIEQINNQQFWVAEETMGAVYEKIERARLTIERLKVVAVLVSIFLTFFILRNQRIVDRKLAYQANTDMLTRLPNRTSQINNIQSQISKKPNSIFAIVFFDIDYFKIINDNYGHDIGDMVLNKFASKIKPHLKKEDILSRFGGDEFVLLLRSIDSVEHAQVYIKKLSSRLDTSFQIGNIEVFITASIGVSMYSPDCTDDCKNPKTLLKHADIAMYSAKHTSRNCYRFFSNETKRKIESEHAICHALHTILRNANEDNELYLKYQPLLNIKNRDVTECEALIRWTNKAGENILPNDFIPLAEKNNLIEKINLFVINEACLQQYRWQKINIKPIRININLSGNKVIFNKLIEQLRSNLVKYDLESSLFGIELTERTINHISKETIQQLEQLRKEGMKISIDDFGTGYSSLNELKKLPVTTLKIDKAFIQGLPNDKKDHALVKTIIDLGHSLDLDVVAEGVETFEQYQFLKEHFCNVAQGYYYQQPLNGEQLAQLQLLEVA